MFCEQCGAKLENYDKFCTQCGGRVREEVWNDLREKADEVTRQPAASSMSLFKEMLDRSSQEAPAEPIFAEEPIKAASEEQPAAIVPADIPAQTAKTAGAPAEDTPVEGQPSDKELYVPENAAKAEPVKAAPAVFAAEDHAEDKTAAAEPAAMTSSVKKPEDEEKPEAGKGSFETADWLPVVFAGLLISALLGSLIAVIAAVAQGVKYHYFSSMLLSDPLLTFFGCLISAALTGYFLFKKQYENTPVASALFFVFSAVGDLLCLKNVYGKFGLIVSAILAVAAAALLAVSKTKPEEDKYKLFAGGSLIAYTTLRFITLPGTPSGYAAFLFAPAALLEVLMLKNGSFDEVETWIGLLKDKLGNLQTERPASAESGAGAVKNPFAGLSGLKNPLAGANVDRTPAAAVEAVTGAEGGFEVPADSSGAAVNPIETEAGHKKKGAGSLLGNILWFIFGGFIAAVLWFLEGLLWCITIIGIPLGKQCFKFSKLALHPFGKDILFGGRAGSSILNLFWIIFTGWWNAIICAAIGLGLCITVVGIPFGLQYFKFAKLMFMPFGAQIVDK